MQNFINNFLKIIKYPIALFSILFVYPIFLGLVHFLHIGFSEYMAVYFIAPIIGIVALWCFIPGLNGSALTIFAHESTHMLWALLTFHKPVSMKIEEDKGGSFTYRGKGNWLITIAPYFFPTFPLLWMLVGLFVQHNPTFPNWYIIAFGGIVGFHIAANFTQIHAEQTDFKKAGWIFTFLFLPSANLILLGYLWAFAMQGWQGLHLWTQIYLPGCQVFLNILIQQFDLILS